MLKSLRALLPNHRMIRCFGGKGIGKSYLINLLCEENVQSLYIDFRPQYPTSFSEIAIALGQRIAEPNENLYLLLRYLQTSEPKLIVLDHLEFCDNNAFRVIQNIINSSNFNKKITELVVYDDLILNGRNDAQNYRDDLTKFYECRLYPEKDLQYFIEVLKGITHLKLSDENLTDLLKAANYNLNALIEIIDSVPCDSPLSSETFDRMRIELLSADVKRRLSIFNHDQLEIINDTATVGTEFNSDLITACFEIAEIDSILLQIMRRDTKLFRVLKGKTYSFYTKETRDCIYADMDADIKIILNKKIAEYCFNQATQYNFLTKKISYLFLAHDHYIEANDLAAVLSTGHQLLKLYEASNDIFSALKLATALYEKSIGNEKIYIGLYVAYLLTYQDRYLEANGILSEVRLLQGTIKNATTYLYIDLWQAFHNYVSSAVPKAKEILDVLKAPVSMSADHVLKFKYHSLLTSMYENDGNMRLSTKHRKQAKREADQCCSPLYQHILETKSLIFLTDGKAMKALYNALQYFEKQMDENQLAQLRHNYGSANLFHCKLEEAEKYLQMAYRYYQDKGSVWVSYPYNNLAIIHILRKEYKEALQILQQPYPCDTELFTEVTITCNVISCYLKLNQIEVAKACFTEISNIVKERKNEEASLYIDIYLKIIEAMIAFNGGYRSDACRALEKIEIPNGYEFIKEFIIGICDIGKETKTEYQYPYIRMFVEQQIYLCDLLFIE